MRTLRDLSPGESAVVRSNLARGSMRRRLLDLGLTENRKVTCVGRSPWGDPTAYLICGAVIALRAGDSGRICLWD